MKTLTTLIPDEMLVLLLAFAGILMVLGMRKAAISMAVLAIASPCVGVLASVVLDALPLWMLVLLGLVMILSVLRGAASVLIGRHASDAMTGELAAGVVRGLLKLPLLALRVVWRALAAVTLRR